MDLDTSPVRRSERMEEMRCMLERDLDQNCLNKPDFIDDVLLQKDLYGSYKTIDADPVYKPTYTFTDADTPCSVSNPISLLNKSDKKQNLVRGEHGMGSDAYSSYREETGTVSLLEPTFDNQLDACDYEEGPPTQGWEEDMIDLRPEFSGAENYIICKATLGPYMDVDSEGVDLAVVDAPQLTINETPIGRILDVSDYKIDTCSLVEQENGNVDSEKPKISHIDDHLITEAFDHGIDQKSGSVDLDVSDLPQLSLDAIPMESILEGSDNEEISLIRVDSENMNIDLLGQIFSGVDNSTVNEPIDFNKDLINGGIDLEVFNVLHVNNTAMPIGRTGEISGQLKNEVNQEATLLEKTLDQNYESVCMPPDKPYFEGKSRSQSPIYAMDNNRRSMSQSCGRSQTNSSTSCRCSKSPMQYRHLVRSRDRYRMSQSPSGNNSRYSCRRSQSRICSRDRYRRSHSRSGVNSSDSRRSQSKSKFGTYSRDHNRRTWSRSRSPIKSRDLGRRSHSRSPINSRGFHKSQSQSHISHRDLRRLSPRHTHVKQRRNWSTQQSPKQLKSQQSLHCCSSRWSPTRQKRHSSPPPVR